MLSPQCCAILGTVSGYVRCDIAAGPLSRRRRDTHFFLDVALFSVRHRVMFVSTSDHVRPDIAIFLPRCRAVLGPMSSCFRSEVGPLSARCRVMAAPMLGPSWLDDGLFLSGRRANFGTVSSCICFDTGPLLARRRDTSMSCHFQQDANLSPLRCRALRGPASRHCCLDVVLFSSRCRVVFDRFRVLLGSASGYLFLDVVLLPDRCRAISVMMPGHFRPGGKIFLPR